MRFTGTIRKMPDNPTYGRVGTEGLFYVIIEAQESDIFIEQWQPFEITAENVTFQEGEEILRNRLKELRESAVVE
jgi:hypothetical protein